MIGIFEYVYYVSLATGVSLKKTTLRKDGEICLEWNHTITCDRDGKTHYNDVLPSVFESTTESYNKLVALYGVDNVPKPKLKLESVELLQYLCKKHGTVDCYHEPTKTIVTVCGDVVSEHLGLYISDVDETKGGYSVTDLEPVDDCNLFISTNYAIYDE